MGFIGIKKILFIPVLLFVISVIFLAPNLAYSQITIPYSQQVTNEKCNIVSQTGGSVKLDKCAYPVPYGQLFSGTITGPIVGDFPTRYNGVFSEPGVFPIHRDITNSVGITTTNSLSNGDTLVHIRVNDHDFNTSPVGTDKNHIPEVQITRQGSAVQITRQDSPPITFNTAGQDTSTSPVPSPGTAPTPQISSTYVSVTMDYKGEEYGINLPFWEYPVIAYSMQGDVSDSDLLNNLDFMLHDNNLKLDMPLGETPSTTDRELQHLLNTPLGEPPVQDQNNQKSAQGYDAPLGEPSAEEKEKERILNMPLGESANSTNDNSNNSTSESNAPYVTITGPSEITFTKHHPTINGTVSNGVNFVKVYLDGKDLGADLWGFNMVNNTWHYTFDPWSGGSVFPIGTHVITAVAIYKDNTNITSNSQTITLVIPAPTITSVTDGTSSYWVHPEDCHSCPYINGTKDSETNAIRLTVLDKTGDINSDGVGAPSCPVHFDSSTTWSCIFAFPYGLREGTYTISATSALIGDAGERIGGDSSGNSNTVTLHVLPNP